MKDAIYKENPDVLLELKKAIANIIRNIPSIKLLRVFANEVKPVDTCLQEHRGHFQHLL
jgi:hypothetical protein